MAEENKTYDVREKIGQTLEDRFSSLEELEPGSEESNKVVKEIDTLTKLLQQYDSLELGAYNDEQKRELERQIAEAKLDFEKENAQKKLDQDQANKDAETALTQEKIKSEKKNFWLNVGKTAGTLALTGIMFFAGMSWENSGHTFRSKMWNKMPKL